MPAPRPLVVLEIGGNALGDGQLTAEMVRAAARLGAPAVKFQAFRARAFIHPSHPGFAELAREETPFAVLADAMELAHSLGIKAGLTVFDQEGVEFASRHDADFVKISSGDLTYHALLRLAAASGIPLALSTGASTQEEVEAALRVVAETGARLWSLLQCSSLYPTPPEAANLAVMDRWLGDGLPAGFSDHTLGVQGAFAALALGARLLEKHFTVDRALPGGDNFMSATPQEAAAIARRAAKAERAENAANAAGGAGGGADPRSTPYYGDPQKRLGPLERPELIRRAAVAARALSRGAPLHDEDLLFQRVPPPPGDEPLLRPDEPFAGRALVRPKEKGEPLLARDLASA
ncbi:MAG: N-acetylneuraminate synthase family protein [Deltaproteobacteria bacterium]|jgi:N-acetylneuraminate synthase/N,N'-diacetyllegionaminate synthase|nr:N-acetylneuraminate synthase family protein [Deltaproteobacteria bacterium]